MSKLTTAASVVVFAAALGAQTVWAQTPATQTPATQSVPQTPPKPTTPAAPQTPAAQAPAPAAPTQTAKPAAPPPAQGTGRATATLFVTNPSGVPVPDVKITLTGATDREVVTTRDAATRIPNLRSGTYRARFDAPDYVLFEKELVLRAGQPWEFEVTLSPAPAKKVEAPPAAPPAAAKKPVAPPPEPAGEVSMLSLPDWIDQHAIGRNEPQRDSIVSQAPGATATILQVRENVTDQVHAGADAFLYVIANEATLRIGGRVQAISPGWFVSIPRGTTYSIERRGRNPVIVLLILAPSGGAPAESR